MSDPKVTGVITPEVLRKYGFVPPKEVLYSKPIAIVECIEEIPCDVCTWACPFSALTKDSLTSLPKIDFSKCTGCGRCVAMCPGQAIFVIDLSREDKAFISLPYEMIPKPEKGDRVILLDRWGHKAGFGRIVSLYEDNRTYVVKVEVPRELVFDIRAIKVVRDEKGD